MMQNRISLHNFLDIFGYCNNKQQLRYEQVMVLFSENIIFFTKN